MKKALILLSLVIALRAMFPAKALSQNEFEGVVSLDKTIHNFGVILLSEGEKKCTFTVTNINTRPIIIHKVISSCGCTEPTWTKNPIMPGKKGEINITFMNDQGPYPFDKSITVYISDLSKPINLRVRGIVQEKKKSVQETYLETIGALGMTEKKFDLGQVEQGLSRSSSTTIANVSGKPIDIAFVNVSRGLDISLDKSRIGAGETATLKFSIDTQETDGEKWGNTVFLASVKINGVVQKRKIRVEALIKENFSTLTKEQKRIGSLPYFEESSYNFGSIAEGRNIDFDLSFTNNGKSDLKIYKIDCEEENVTFSYPESTPYNEKGILNIKIDTNGMAGEKLFIVTLITNSPLRPIVNILVTGIIK